MTGNHSDSNPDLTTGHDAQATGGAHAADAPVDAVGGVVPAHTESAGSSSTGTPSDATLSTGTPSDATPSDATPSAGRDHMTDSEPITTGETGPGCRKRDPIVIAENVTRSFGGVNAVDVEHLEIPRHKITALIGPNGAGKTTLFNLLTGFDTPNSGDWEFDGRPLAKVASHKVARMGMVRTFQLTKVMGKLTVMENMRLGATDQPGESLARALFKGIWGGREREITQQAEVLLAKFKLDTKRDEYAASLSGGQRKLLEMARALMVRPRLVMLDEPMAGVNPALTQSLLEHIKNLKAEGMTVLFVEHDMHVVRHIADWVVVMAEGKVVAEGPPDIVMKDQAVIDAYLGAHHDVDLGDSTGIERLEEELAHDKESVVGSEDEGVLGHGVTEVGGAHAAPSTSTNEETK